MGDNPYRIAIVGSYDPARTEELNLREPKLAPEAGRQLGQALAKRGFFITVYASYAHLLEVDVVRGYLEAISDDIKHCIEVRYSHQYDEPRFPGQAEGEDPRFNYRTDVNDNWEVSFYQSIKDSDGMLLMGGGPSSLIAGIVAISHDKAVVPCAYFGGETKKVWEALTSSRWATTEERQRMANAWTDSSAERMVDIMEAQIQRRQQEIDAKKAERQREIDAIVAGVYAAKNRVNWLIGAGFTALIVVIMIIAISLNDPVLTDTNWLVLMMIAAGLMGIVGAMVGAIFDRSEETQKKKYTAMETTILGFVAGFVTAALFVLAQDFASPVVVEDSEQILRYDRLLLLTSIIGVVAGLTFETVFPRIRSIDVVHTGAISAGTVNDETTTP